MPVVLKCNYKDENNYDSINKSLRNIENKVERITRIKARHGRRREFKKCYVQLYGIGIAAETNLIKLTKLTVKINVIIVMKNKN